MGNVGDYWNEHREFKRAARSTWHECTSPGCQFGGNPVKVAPGDKCRHCGVRAPGQPGSDIQFARDDEARRAIKESKRLENEAATLKARTCQTCGKVCGTKRGRIDHEKMKHAPEHPLKEATRRGFADQGP